MTRSAAWTVRWELAPSVTEVVLVGLDSDSASVRTNSSCLTFTRTSTRTSPARSGGPIRRVEFPGPWVTVGSPCTGARPSFSPEACGVGGVGGVCGVSGVLRRLASATGSIIRSTMPRIRSQASAPRNSLAPAVSCCRASGPMSAVRTTSVSTSPCVHTRSGGIRTTLSAAVWSVSPRSSAPRGAVAESKTLPGLAWAPTGACALVSAMSTTTSMPSGRRKYACLVAITNGGVVPTGSFHSTLKCRSASPEKMLAFLGFTLVVLPEPARLDQVSWVSWPVDAVSAPPAYQAPPLTPSVVRSWWPEPAPPPVAPSAAEWVCSVCVPVLNSVVVVLPVWASRRTDAPIRTVTPPSETTSSRPDIMALSWSCRVFGVRVS